MTMRAPAAIHSIYDAVKRHEPAAEFLGITGDARHVADGGYHISRSLLLADGMSGDYSIQHAADRLGNPDNSSAIDIGFGYGTPLMKLVTQRLLKAGGDRDPRMRPVREFYGCGPSDSSTDVIGWDFTAHARAYTTDYSHRGHIHLSIIREFSDDTKTLAGIADVIAGIPITPPVQPPKPPTIRKERDMILVIVDKATLPPNTPWPGVFTFNGSQLEHVKQAVGKTSNVTTICKQLGVTAPDPITWDQYVAWGGK